MLLKPTLAVSHGGGQKLEVGSRGLSASSPTGSPPAPRGRRPDDPRIQRLEVFPAAAVLKPKDTLQVARPRLVLRRPRRGRDALGEVQQQRGPRRHRRCRRQGDASPAHGEAAITVWYSNLVAADRIASPLPNAVDPKVFAAAPRHNFIDDLVLQEAGEPAHPAVAAVHRRRVHSPGLPRRGRHPADAGGGAASSSPTSRRTSGRS